MTMILISVVIAYVLGSIPTSYIAGKLIKKIDIRNHGSGNVGATNALRILGVKIGITVMIIDILKGFVAVWLARKFFVDANNSLALIGCGMSAIIGHVFTVFLSFKGGKGVATSAGVFFALTPLAFGVGITVFILLVWITRYVSLGSTVGSASLAITQGIIYFKTQDGLYYFIFTVFIATLIILKHHANIKRLINGNENKISFKK